MQIIDDDVKLPLIDETERRGPDLTRSYCMFSRMNGYVADDVSSICWIYGSNPMFGLKKGRFHSCG